MLLINHNYILIKRCMILKYVIVTNTTCCNCRWFSHCPEERSISWIAETRRTIQLINCSYVTI